MRGRAGYEHEPKDSPDYDDIPTRDCPRCGKEMSYERDGWYCHEEPTEEDFRDGEVSTLNDGTIECAGEILDDRDGPDDDGVGDD